MSNCIVDKSELFKGLSDTAKHIASHDANDKLHKNVFASLIQDAITSTAKTSEEFNKYLRPFEAEILSIRWQNGETVRKKDGSYCYSKVSQSSTYRSNKSVIGKALDAGVLLFLPNGEPQGKTALEKAVKTKRTTIITPVELAQRGVNIIRYSWNALSLEEQNEVYERIPGIGADI